GVKRRASQGSSAPSGVARDLADASWAESDRALARAWRDLAALDDALASATRLVERRRDETAPLLATRVTRAAAHALALKQSLDQAARLRGMSLFGKSGETVTFDRARHEWEKPSQSSSGKIVRPGVERRVGDRYDVLAPALVRAAERRG